MIKSETKRKQIKLRKKLNRHKIIQKPAQKLPKKLKEQLKKPAQKNQVKKINSNTKKFTKVTNLRYKEMKIRWSQRGNRLILDSVLGRYFFKMPRSWKLSNLEPKYLRLAEVIIFKPFWDKNDLNNHLKQTWDTNDNESNGKTRIGIAFSGGNDSSACAAILPKNSVLIYLKRVWDTPRNIMKHEQQLKCLKYLKNKWKMTSYVMETDIELISRYSIGRVGFSTDYVPTVPTILLANYYKIKYICTGTIGLYLKGGYKYLNFLETNYYKFWTSTFKKAGIELFYPVGGCSDRVTEQICRLSKIPGQPCLRNDKGSCNKCFKCFRKNFLIKLSDKSNKDKRKIHINKEIYSKLRRRPITRILARRMGWISDKDIKAYHLKINFSFEHGYHEELTRNLVPEELQEFTIHELNKYCRKMTETEIQTIQKLDLSRLLK